MVSCVSNFVVVYSLVLRNHQLLKTSKSSTGAKGTHHAVVDDDCPRLERGHRLGPKIVGGAHRIVIVSGGQIARVDPVALPRDVLHVLTEVAGVGEDLSPEVDTRDAERI